MVDFNPVVQPIINVLGAILWPAIAVIGAIGTIYSIVLGVRFAKAEDPNSREIAKKNLVGAVVGFLIIFILIVALKLTLPILQDWVEQQV